jgi:hypothetical protein
MPSDFLCLCQPRFSAVSRGEIFIKTFLVAEKQVFAQQTFIPDLGSTFVGTGTFRRTGVWACRRVGVSRVACRVSRVACRRGAE